MLPYQEFLRTRLMKAFSVQQLNIKSKLELSGPPKKDPNNTKYACIFKVSENKDILVNVHRNCYKIYTDK